MVRTILTHVWAWARGKRELIVHACNGMVLRQEIAAFDGESMRRLTSEIIADMHGAATAIYEVRHCLAGVEIRFHHVTDDFVSAVNRVAVDAVTRHAIRRAALTGRPCRCRFLAWR